MGIRQIVSSPFIALRKRHVLIHGTSDDKKREAAKALAKGGILGVRLLCGTFRLPFSVSTLHIAADELMHLIEVDNSKKKMVAKPCRDILSTSCSTLEYNIDRAQGTSPEGLRSVLKIDKVGVGIHKDGHEREFYAIKLLGRVGDKKSAVALEKRLKMSIAASSTYLEYDQVFVDARHHEMEVCAAIVKALRTMAVHSLDGCVDILTRGLRHPNQYSRCKFIELLGQVGNPRAIAALKSTIRNEEDRMRNSAAKELKKLNWEPENDDEKIWFFIALHNFFAAAHIGNEALEPMLKVLLTLDYETIPKAAHAIGMIGNADAIEPLEEAYKLAWDLYATRSSKLDMDIVEPPLGYITNAIDEIRKRIETS